MRKLIVAGFLLWFPFSLDRIHKLGYDFPIYYNSAKYGATKGWYYAEWVRYAFKVLTIFPMDVAFAIFYAVCILAWVQSSKRVGIFLSIVSVYPMLLCLELGQITPILAYLCLFPIRSVIAFGIKPLCLPFVLLHLTAHFTRGNLYPRLQQTEPLIPSSLLGADP